MADERHDLVDDLRTLTILILLAAAPASVGAAAFCWRLWWDDFREFPEGGPIRFSLILALTGSLAAIGAVIFGLIALAVLLEIDGLREFLASWFLVALMTLDVIPIINAGYLRLRRRRRRT